MIKHSDMMRMRDALPLDSEVILNVIYAIYKG